MTDSVSLQEVLEESRELEEIANAVLGDSDDSCCTYAQVTCPDTSLEVCQYIIYISGLHWEASTIRV